MLPPPFEKALVLTGPTGSGKTQLGIEIARQLDAEIISMDSMALYRGMDIGTAKPTPEERGAVPHHLIDVREPWESASVAWWLDQARLAAHDIQARGKQILIVGGTPLYLKALIHGLFEGPPADDAIRSRLIEFVQAHGSPALHERLAAVDSLSAERIHPNDVRRMVRALEVFELTGKPMSVWQTQWHGTQDAAPDRVHCVWIERNREELYERINRRIVQMFDDGLVDEVRRLCSLEHPLSHEAAQALGYKEIFDLLNEKVSENETIVRIQTRSRNFAKRQISWFRHIPECRPMSVELTRDAWGQKMKQMIRAMS
jgi:tRNA dimethylallyltransferase